MTMRRGVAVESWWVVTWFSTGGPTMPVCCNPRIRSDHQHEDIWECACDAVAHMTDLEIGLYFVAEYLD